LALSPDGTHLAYAAIHGGTQQLYLRAMDSTEARPISGTEGASSPFFSPDGQWLGFFAGGKLRKISVNGGAAFTLGDAPTTWGASWGSGGSIVFQSIAGAPLQQVPEAGGIAQPLAPLQKGDGGNIWPDFLPGGQAVLFDGGSLASPKIALQSIARDDRRDLVPSGGFPRFAASGHLIYVQAGTLMAAPFDP
jgi:serine/threonine-protein kinase